MTMDTNTLYYGDCLEWMQRWDDESVDLIYLDPPFNSKANYNMLYSNEIGEQAQFQAFNDTWVWDEAAVDRFSMYAGAFGKRAHNAIVGLHNILGESGMLAYLTYMAERLEEMYRLLKPTGSIYLHCDPAASHYLKIVMDSVFGAKNFRNEIIWRIGWVSGYKTQKQGWIRNHDTLLYYLKTSRAIKRFNKSYIPYPVDYVRRDGKKPTGKGFPIEDTWNCHSGDELDSIMIKSFSKEKMGYPTQKTVALLERIVKASSNDGDVVLDPFCGCGTTVEAARNLGRNWVGIDISSFAIDLIRDKRLKNPNIPIKGIPFDFTSANKLAKENPFNFESWAITRLTGFIPNTKQVKDGGIDGCATLAYQPDDYDSRLGLAQVKGTKGFHLSSLRDFIHVCNRDKAAVGCFVSLNQVNSREANKEVANKGKIHVNGYEYPRMQLWSIKDYFEKKFPNLPIMNDPYTGKPITHTQYTLF